MNSGNILLIIFFSFFSITINAQLEKLTEKVKEKVNERIEQKVDETIDETLDDAEEGMTAKNKKETKKQTKKEKPSAVKANKADKEEDGENNDSEQPVNKKQVQSKSKFDFIPGDKILFFDDFADVAIGDFPMNWETGSSAEVVTLDNQPGKWLKLKGDYSYFSPVIKNMKLPENFTIEFDVVCPDDHNFSLEIYESIDMKVGDDYYPGKGGTMIGFDQEQVIWKTWTESEEPIYGDAPNSSMELGKKLHYSIWGQKSRLRVYCAEVKVLDIPRGIKNDLKLNFLRFGNYPNTEMLLSNIRVAVGSPDMRSRLLTEGKFSTNGITFDSGSDKIKPESYAVLKEIAGILKDNAAVKVKIIGHTDSDGNDASNLTLSKKRAEAVKNSLSNEFSIDASRMTTDGKGESEPAVKNDTPQGKAANRRVEFIKQ